MPMHFVIKSNNNNCGMKTTFVTYVLIKKKEICRVNDKTTFMSKSRENEVVITIKTTFVSLTLYRDHKKIKWNPHNTILSNVINCEYKINLDEAKNIPTCILSSAQLPMSTFLLYLQGWFILKSAEPSTQVIAYSSVTMDTPNTRGEIQTWAWSLCSTSYSLRRAERFKWVLWRGVGLLV